MITFFSLFLVVLTPGWLLPVCQENHYTSKEGAGSTRPGVSSVSLRRCGCRLYVKKMLTSMEEDVPRCLVSPYIRDALNE